MQFKVFGVAPYVIKKGEINNEVEVRRKNKRNPG